MDQRRTILLADDNDVLRNVLALVLQRAGYEVIAVPGVRAAADAVAQADRLDVVVADLRMPDGTIADLVPQLGSRHPGVRMMVVSGYPESHAAAVLEAFPGSRFLQKPFTPAELTDAIAELLRGYTPGRDDA